MCSSDLRISVAERVPGPDSQSPLMERTLRKAAFVFAGGGAIQVASAVSIRRGFPKPPPMQAAHFSSYVQPHIIAALKGSHHAASASEPAFPLRISGKLRSLDQARTNSLSPWDTPASGIRISADRARESLDITVPIGTCVICAMSL